MLYVYTRAVEASVGKILILVRLQSQRYKTTDVAIQLYLKRSYLN